VSSLFAGDYDPEMVAFIVEKICESLSNAAERLEPASFAYTESAEPQFIRNRLLNIDSLTDGALQTLHFRQESGDVLFSVYGAHATLLDKTNHQLSADYPGYFNTSLKQHANVHFSSFAAGAVGNMGYRTAKSADPFFFGKNLAAEVEYPEYYMDTVSLLSFQIPLVLPQPQFRVGDHLVLRPIWFEKFFGRYSATISVAKIDKTIILGMPCDFSGELAVPLKKFAAQKGYQLIITSFNGGYIGYVSPDKWYDLDKYETRTMNWYGYGMGEYFTSLVEEIIIAL
ncbi:MAG: hypothetical protein AAF789_01795, partial [Bacteroidota bacterium]